MNKRVVTSLLVVLAVALATFAATSAYFSSNSSTTGSKFVVGTLDLAVGGTGGSSVEPFLIDNIGETSVTSGSKTWVVTNKGTLTGRLYFKLVNVSNTENGCNTPELAVDASCDNPGTGQGELGKQIAIKVYLNDLMVAESDLDEVNKNKITAAWSNLTPVMLKAGETARVKLEWLMANESYGNEIQSDSLGFDVDFSLVQVN